jgi:hypothetical protein
VNETGCRSFNSLEGVERTTAVYVPSAVCTGLVTTRLPCTSTVLPEVLSTVKYNS